MKPGDILVDFDQIANALAGLEPANHEHTDIVKKVTKAARDAAIREAQKHTSDIDVLVIHSTPAQSTIDRYKREGAKVITVDPGKQTVMRRIKQERPKHMLAVAAKWYEQQDKPKGTTERGYGWRHQQNRQRLLYNLVDGTPCPGCGKPMYKKPEKNHDGAALEADHTRDLKHHGPGDADRLLCRTCNRARKDGHDERLPLNKAKREAEQKAAQGTPPAPGSKATGWDWL